MAGGTCRATQKRKGEYYSQDEPPVAVLKWSTAMPPVVSSDPATASHGRQRTDSHGARRIRQGQSPAVSKALLGTPLLIFGFGVAWLTQRAITQGASGEQALGGFALASVLFVAGLWLSPRTGVLTWRGPIARPEPRGVTRGAASVEPVSGRSTSPGWTEVRKSTTRTALGISLPLAGASAILSVITFLTSGGNQFTWLNTSTWVGSVALGLAACWQPPVVLSRWRATVRRLRVPRETTIRLRRTHLALLAIVAFGSFLLFYRIGEISPEMQSDHAEKLLDVQDVLNGQHRIFFPRNTGREAFQFYWIALMTPLTGLTYLTMKLGTALLGVLTIVGTFCLARVFFGTPTALLAAFILSVSRWHLLIARRGLRFPFPALFGAATFFFLFRALRDRHRNDFLLCGLLLGIALHTYIPLRFAPLGVLVCLGIALAVDVWLHTPPARVRRLVVDSGLLFAIAGLVFMPLGRYAFDNPGPFLFRGMSRITGDAGAGTPPNVLGVFATNVKDALLAFNWRGDTAWVNNIPLEPFLDPVSGALFALGSVYAMYRIVRFRELPYIYVLLLIFVGMLPSIISISFPVENPATARGSMALPFTILLVSATLSLLARRVRVWVGGAAGIVASAALVGILAFAIFQTNYRQYFHIYPQQYLRVTEHPSNVADAINGFIALGGQRKNAYIVVWPHWIDVRSVAIQAGEPYWRPDIPSADEALKHDGTSEPRLYIVHPDDKASLQKLLAWYPTAIQQTHTLRELDGRAWFTTVLVPPGARAAR